jgi:hypothetical protein
MQGPENEGRASLQGQQPPDVYSSILHLQGGVNHLGHQMSGHVSPGSLEGPLAP